MKQLVDTCIINRLIDGLLSTNGLPAEGQFVATHIQMDELRKTSYQDRRTSLLQKFFTLVDVMVPTESTVQAYQRSANASSATAIFTKL